MPLKRGTPTIRRGNVRGAAVVEFAVIASLLLVIIFGILEFALIFMQGHLVENGAREGVRVGVRANNYTNFHGIPTGNLPADTVCTEDRCDRELATQQAVQEYLDIFYELEPNENILVTRGENNGQPVLSVTVTVDNFLPPLVSALVPGYTRPITFSFTATGFYEDPAEYEEENP